MLRYNKTGESADQWIPLQNDILNLLTTFNYQHSLSFDCYRQVWSSLKFGKIQHVASKKVLSNQFIQLLFDTTLKLFVVPSVQGSTGLDVKNVDCVIKTAVWNVGLIYTLYCLYHTQMCSPPAQIRINSHCLDLLYKAVLDIDRLGSIGDDAKALFSKLQEEDAFLFCAYTGPRSLHFAARSLCCESTHSASMEFIETIELSWYRAENDTVVSDGCPSGGTSKRLSGASNDASQASAQSTHGPCGAVSVVGTEDIEQRLLQSIPERRTLRESALQARRAEAAERAERRTQRLSKKLFAPSKSMLKMQARLNEGRRARKQDRRIAVPGGMEQQQRMSTRHSKGKEAPVKFVYQPSGNISDSSSDSDSSYHSSGDEHESGGVTDGEAADRVVIDPVFGGGHRLSDSRRAVAGTAGSEEIREMGGSLVDDFDLFVSGMPLPPIQSSSGTDRAVRSTRSQKSPSPAAGTSAQTKRVTRRSAVSDSTPRSSSAKKRAGTATAEQPASPTATLPPRKAHITASKGRKAQHQETEKPVLQTEEFDLSMLERLESMSASVLSSAPPTSHTESKRTGRTPAAKVATRGSKRPSALTVRAAGEQEGLSAPKKKQRRPVGKLVKRGDNRGALDAVAALERLTASVMPQFDSSAGATVSGVRGDEALGEGEPAAVATTDMSASTAVPSYLDMLAQLESDNFDILGTS